MFFEPSGWWKKHLSQCPRVDSEVSPSVIFSQISVWQASSISSDQHTVNTGCKKKSPSLPCAITEFVSMFWEQLRVSRMGDGEHEWLLCGPALPGRWFQHSILGKMNLKKIVRWSMVSIPHSLGEGISQGLLAYVCLWVGSGVKFECHVCWGWAYRLLSSMVHAVSLQMLGLRWYRVLRWMFWSDALCDERITMISRV